MKAVVLLEDSREAGVSQEELREHWDALKEIPGLEISYVNGSVYPDPETVSSLIGDADAAFGIWIGPDIINEDIISRHPALRYIGMLGHGYEMFEQSVADRHHLTLTNTIYGSATIAEYGFALLMEVCHHVNEHSRHIHSTDWTDPANKELFCHTLSPQIELYGKTMGIVGLGNIGLHMARIARGFGMNVIGWSRHKKSGSAYDGITQTDTLDQLLAKSDVVSLHVPHTPETTGLINADTLRKMKKTAILINTARGALIDEAALADALRRGEIYAAGLDVLTEEPPLHGSPLIDAPRCVITGHIAWLTRESRLRAVDMAVDQYKSYLAGNPVSVIHGSVLDMII